MGFPGNNVGCVVVARGNFAPNTLQKCTAYRLSFECHSSNMLEIDSKVLDAHD